MSARERRADGGRPSAASIDAPAPVGGSAVGPRAGSPAARSTAGPSLVLDPIACVGHGLCAELFPEGVVLDDWGFPIVLPEASDPAHRAHARRAAKACPVLALKLAAGRGR